MARLLLLVCLAAAAFSMTVAAATTAAPATAPTTAAPTRPPTTAAPTRAPTTVNPRCQPACPNKKAGRVPNLCRCQAYFECDKRGNATPQLCEPWQNFDPVKLQCDLWDRVKCIPMTTQPPTTREPTTPAPTTRAPPVPGCAWLPDCPATGSAKLGIPCPDSCNSYVQCDGGNWSKKKCTIGKFDTKSNKCVWWGATCAA